MNDEHLIWEKYISIINEDMEYDKELNPEIESYAKSKGYTIEAYHGSREKELTQISKMHTSYGLFFSPDPYTSSGYTGNKEGKVYHVLLYAPDDSKILDITDDRARYEFFTKHMGSGNVVIVSKEPNYYSQYDELNDKVIRKTILDSLTNNPEIKDFLIKKYNLDDTLESFLEDLEYEVESDLWELIDEPVIWNLFKDDYRKVDQEVNDMINAYGSQDFYLNYQDEFLKTAESLGYDIVMFDDPATSAGGEALSYVVFDPHNIKLADTETYDNDGNVIPLNKRFNKNISDIRY